MQGLVPRRALAALLLGLALLGPGCRSTGGGGGGGTCPTCGQALAGRSVEGGKCPACGGDLRSGGGRQPALGVGAR